MYLWCALHSRLRRAGSGGLWQALIILRAHPCGHAAGAFHPCSHVVGAFHPSSALHSRAQATSPPCSLHYRTQGTAGVAGCPARHLHGGHADRVLQQAMRGAGMVRVESPLYREVRLGYAGGDRRSTQLPVYGAADQIQVRLAGQ